MSRAVSRILLTVILIPTAFMFFAVAYEVIWRLNALYEPQEAMVASGLMTWLFVVAYWILLWRKTTHWNRYRIKWTSIAAVSSLFIAGILTWLLNYVENNLGYATGCYAAPLVWLIWVTLLWQESPIELAQRMRVAGKGSIVCPACGYNLIGLQGTRCPECGTLYTLDEILIGQSFSFHADITN